MTDQELDELKAKLLELHSIEHTTLLETVFELVVELEDFESFKFQFFELMKFATEDEDELGPPGPHLKRIK